MKKLDDDLELKNKYIDQLTDTIEQYKENIEIKNEELKRLKRELLEGNERIPNLNVDGDAVKANYEMDEKIERLKDEYSLQDLVIPKKSNWSDKRITELENALRETIQISTERELILQDEEKKRRNIMQKVFKLEQRLLSLQTAQALKCHSCNQYVKRMANLESRLSRLQSERKENLKELNRMKMDALESTISEKDAHLALLEINGIRNAKQADEAEKLQIDKRMLMERLKQENEISMSLCQQNEIDDDSNISDNSD